MHVIFSTRFKQYFLAILILGASLFALFLYFNYATPRANALTPCSTSESVLFCYIDNVHIIMEQDGVDAALAYVNETVQSESVYQITHLVLHEVGKEAYYEFSDFDEALSRLSPYVGTPGFIFTFDGYRHGFYQKFLEGKLSGAKEPAQEVQALCSEYLTATSISSLDKNLRNAAASCFHGIGHALMYVTDYDIAAANPYCAELPYPWMKNFCYYGSFMEYTYTPWGQWNPEKPRPEVYDMIKLCQDAPEEQRNACYRFIGRASLSLDPSNISEALGQCDLINEEYQEVCVLETSAVAIPAVFREDFEGMVASCNRLAPKYEETCLFGVASGIKQGSAGLALKSRPFCQLVDEKFQKRCLSSTGRDYTVF